MNFKYFFKQFLTERTNLSKGCAMIYFKPDILDHLQNEVDKEDLYSKEGFGLEDEPHCTLLYGFLPECDPKEIMDMLKDQEYPDEVELHNVSLFENEEYDVLKFDIDNKILRDINEVLRTEFPYENDYDEFHAHATVGYLKSGTGEKYVEKFKNEKILAKPEKIVYSDPDKTKTTYQL